VSKRVTGIYQDGVVKLLDPVEAASGTKVEVVFHEASPVKTNVREFAGMLSDLTEEEWEQFQRVVQRRPPFGN
jgi:predicted DNA-binding antitoxin AbrB/MazE fold protein